MLSIVLEPTTKGYLNGMVLKVIRMENRKWSFSDVTSLKVNY